MDSGIILSAFFKNGGGYIAGVWQARQGIVTVRAYFGTFFYGPLHVRQDRLQEARYALKQATDLQPMAPHGWYRLAHVDMALGAPDEALQVLDHLRQFEPKVGAQLERDIELYGGAVNLKQNGSAHGNLS